MVNRTYLRLTDQWQIVANPREKPLYLVNTSGTTIQVWPSEATIANPTSDILQPFQIGGSIGQFHVPAEQYLYARAVMRRTWNIPIDQQEEEEAGTIEPIPVPVDAIIVMDEEPISPNEQGDIANLFDQLQIEVMKLSNRVSDQKVDYIRYREEFILFQRHMYHVLLGLHNDHAASSNRILDLNMRLFAAEMFIRDYREKFSDVELQIEKLTNSTEINETIATVKNQLSVIQNTTNAVIARLNEVSPKLDQFDVSIQELKDLGLETLITDVADTARDLSTLNNALVQLAAEHTEEELNDIFNQLIENAPEEMVDPIGAIKAIVDKINASLVNDARQDEEIENKVGRDDSIILTGDLDIAELAG